MAPRVATYSIAACDLDARQWGVAVQSKFLAAASVVSFAEAETGAVATQAYANPRYGPDGLALLREGLSADDVVGQLDRGRRRPRPPSAGDRRPRRPQRDVHRPGVPRLGGRTHGLGLRGPGQHPGLGRHRRRARRDVRGHGRPAARRAAARLPRRGPGGRGRPPRPTGGGPSRRPARRRVRRPLGRRRRPARGRPRAADRGASPHPRHPRAALRPHAEGGLARRSTTRWRRSCGSAWPASGTRAISRTRSSAGLRPRTSRSASRESTASIRSCLTSCVGSRREREATASPGSTRSSARRDLEAGPDPVAPRTSRHSASTPGPRSRARRRVSRPRRGTRAATRSSIVVSPAARPSRSTARTSTLRPGRSSSWATRSSNARRSPPRPDTTVLAIGAKPGEAYQPLGWEWSSEAFPFFGSGDPERAYELLAAADAEHPGSPSVLYNLACAEALTGGPRKPSGTCGALSSSTSPSPRSRATTATSTRSATTRGTPAREPSASPTSTTCPPRRRARTAVTARLRRSSASGPSVSTRTAASSGNRVIEEHDELGTAAGRHEELYVVLRAAHASSSDGDVRCADRHRRVRPRPRGSAGGACRGARHPVLVVGGQSRTRVRGLDLGAVRAAPTRTGAEGTTRRPSRSSATCSPRIPTPADPLQPRLRGGLNGEHDAASSTSRAPPARGTVAQVRRARTPTSTRRDDPRFE